MRFSCLVLLIVLGVAPLSLAKRLPPPDVRPIVFYGVEYAAHGDGTHGWITATEVATRKELWTAKVFRIHTYWWKGEEDNQLIYISEMKLEQNILFIEDEKSRCYRLNVNTRHVRRVRCH